MKFTDQLAAAERLNQSLLCVGLDPEPAKFPGAMKGDASCIFAKRGDVGGTPLAIRARSVRALLRHNYIGNAASLVRWLR